MKSRFISLVLMALCSSVALANCYDKKASPDSNYQRCSQEALKGDSIAQYYMAQMYRKGDGVAKDEKEALRWYRKAAAQKNRLAQYNLGWMYDTGEGVEANPEEAIDWYGEAAKQGDQYAPYNIGFLYYTGTGVTVDFAKAQFWFLVARLNGNPKVDRWLKKNIARMSDEQKNQAIALFEVWKAEHPPVELSESAP
ncbi:MAG: sel1 repeat family protein [Methylococcales bacterium]|nr:sel1 repeat family protein [Methylococcales bacterium]